MVVNKNNIYAFDECSILKLCEIKIPKAYKPFIPEDVLLPRNHNVLKRFIYFLDSNNISKYKFVPDNFEMNSIKLVNQLLEES